MPLKPVDTLARWACIALYGCAAFYAVSFFGVFGNLDQLEQAAAYERSIGQKLYLEATPSSDLAVVGLGAIILTAIVFLAFFHRAYSNAGAIAPTEQRYGNGWSIGAWFVPILCLFRPKQIANDIWRGTDASTVPPVFHWWWAFWLLGGLAYFGYDREVMTVSEARTVLLVQAAGEILLVAAAMTGASVVRLIARRQKLRATLIGERRQASFLAAPERVASQPG